MGDRVSISFIDKEKGNKEYDESPAIFHHWGGEWFPEFALRWLKEFKQKIKATNKKQWSTPTTRFEPRNIAVQFIAHLDKYKQLREIDTYNTDEPVYFKDIVSHSIYLGKDKNDGDNTDNGHYTINTATDELKQGRQIIQISNDDKSMRIDYMEEK